MRNKGVPPKKITSKTLVSGNLSFQVKVDGKVLKSFNTDFKTDLKHISQSQWGSIMSSHLGQFYNQQRLKDSTL